MDPGSGIGLRITASRPLPIPGPPNAPKDQVAHGIGSLDVEAPVYVPAQMLRDTQTLVRAYLERQDFRSQYAEMKERFDNANRGDELRWIIEHEN